MLLTARGLALLIERRRVARVDADDGVEGIHSVSKGTPKGAHRVLVTALGDHSRAGRQAHRWLDADDRGTRCRRDDGAVRLSAV